MQIYIEKIIILNVLIHLVVVFGITFLTNNKIKKLNIITSVIIGIINLILYLLYPNSISKWIFILIAFISFFNIKSTLLYIMFNILLGGITGVVNLSLKYYYEVIFICSICILFCIYLLKQDNQYYEVVIKTNKEHTFKSFYDTGCSITTWGIPIIILNKKYNIDLEYFTTINVETISGITKHNVYKARSVYLKINNKKIEKYCLIIKSDIEYDVLIGKNFLGGI